jgi:hypothetical protein
MARATSGLSAHVSLVEYGIPPVRQENPGQSPGLKLWRWADCSPGLRPGFSRQNAPTLNTYEPGAGVSPAPYPTTLDSLARRRQTWNEEPQPQVLVASGLLNTNPRFNRSS